MEGIDHIDVVQVSRCRLISQVDGVVEGQVPDREGLELGVAGLDAALVLVIELGQAGGHLAAAGSGRGHDDQGPFCLDVIIAAEALVADDQRDIGGIAGDGIVAVDAKAQRLELLFIGDGGGLARETGQDHAAHIEAVGREGVHQAQQVHVVGDAQIAADLVLLDVGRIDRDHDLDLVAQGLEHGDLGVRRESGQDPGGVVVVKKLAAEFQVELAAELGDPLADVAGLCLQVLVIVKTDLHKNLSRI